MKSAAPPEKVFLLVDSEGPVAAGDSTWGHIEKTLDCSRPKNADEDSAHLMVECIECWFFADLEALKRSKFQTDELKPVPDVEKISKAKTLEDLRRATGKKYEKSDAPNILQELDPEKVTAAPPHAVRFMQALRDVMNV